MKHDKQCVYETRPDETQTQALKRKYSELLSHKSAHEEVCDLLRQRSDDEAAEILRLLRSGADVESIVHQIRAGDLLLQLHQAPETNLPHKLHRRRSLPTPLR